MGQASLQHIGALRKAEGELARICAVFAVLMLGLLALIYYSIQEQLGEQARYRSQLVAERITSRVEQQLQQIFEREDARDIGDYSFFNISTNPFVQAKGVAFSPLAELPTDGDIPGLLGYFERGADGVIRSPILPGVDIETLSEELPDLMEKELERRLSVLEVLRKSLVGENFSARLPSLPAKETTAEVLESQSIQQNIQQGFLQQKISPDQEFQEFQGARSVPVQVFPLQSLRTSDGMLAIYRVVHSDRVPSMQGFLVHPQVLFSRLVRRVAGEGISSHGLWISIAAQDVSLASFAVEKEESQSLDETSAELLYAQDLAGPLTGFQLSFFGHERDREYEESLIGRLIFLLALILILGTYGIYRVGRSHLLLARDRSNFVSAVTHELKSPLTSIRMYGEMLRSGWVEDEKKIRSYYDYIFHESERLSRLISNVLDLSKLTNQSGKIDVEHFAVEELLSRIDSSVRGQVEHAGFTLTLEKDDRVEASTQILVEPDSFVRIIVNLVDNALKFSKDSERKEVQIGYRQPAADRLQFFVRDFGPGIPEDTRKRIFELFYRGQDELTRDTPGTGIGLAIVRELTQRLGIQVEVENRESGAEFRLIFTERNQ